MSSANQPEYAVSVEHVEKIFADGTHALADVTFSIKSGSFVVIGGANGSGKTVLMTLIAGLENPTGGIIKTSGHVGLVFQDADAQILGETPLEDVVFGAINSGLNKKEADARAKQTLTDCGLGNKLAFSARQLSGGEKRRLAVAGILAMDSDIIIFDEPFANLDWPGVKQVCMIMAHLKQNRKTVIVLTHELEKILALADTFIVLSQGKIRFNGAPSEGIALDLSEWGIRNPLTAYQSVNDLFWG